MYLEKDYIINQQFMDMVGVFDRNAKLCALVTEVERKFFVDKSPLEIIEDSIRFIGFGFDFKEATAASKLILGDINMCPMMINHIHKICIFPDKAAKHGDTRWYNPLHIYRTTSYMGGTNIERTNGQVLWVPIRLSSFNSKWKAADELRDIAVAIANNPITFAFEPNRKRFHLVTRRKKKQLSRK